MDKPAATKRKIAYSYVRFSSPQQMQGDSLRRQTEAADEYCKAHGLVLADLTLRDLGVSAFRGRHAATGALGKFLDATREGRVVPGSTLIVENLDRLSRDQVTTALNQFLSILGAGVEVVTLMDDKRYSLAAINDNPMDLMWSIMVMMRAHDESLNKSKRVGAAWRKKKDAAKASRTPTGRKCPAWVALDESSKRYVPVPERVAVVRRVLKLADDGLGINAICKLLNREGVPTLGRKGKTWDSATVGHYLRTRTLLGEYQPCTMKDGRAVPTGDPVKGYYPAIVSEPEYYRVQSVIDARRTKSPGNTGKLRNLFGGIIVDGDNPEHRMVVNYKTEGGTTWQYLVSYGAVKGLFPIRRFRYDVFERAFLQWVQEIDVGQIATGERQDEHERLRELLGKYTEIKGKLTKVHKAMLDAGGEQFDTLLHLVQGLERQLREVEAEQERLRVRGHAPAVRPRDVVQLVNRMAKATEDERQVLRAKLRRLVLSIVGSVRVYVRHSGMTRLLVAAVALEDGGHRYFAVRTARGEPTTTYSDAAVWADPAPVRRRFARFARTVADVDLVGVAVPSPDEVVRGLADAMAAAAKTAEGMRVVWERGLGGLRDHLLPRQAG